ncbi:MAG TPA: class I SAM-dependent methyltransferase, partial [Candidatus Angelobacter sp.]|nr:class I SAM-dependent methyltransferase [Candidatus Angelobacter sp.]
FQHLPDRPAWRVLDFGCGTGFEAGQALQTLGDRVESLTAYDPSPEMLTLCKNRLKASPRVTFCTRWDEFQAQGPFDLLLTNSLLHHLPSIEETLSHLMPVITTDAFWLAGHEPSSRFYSNTDCVDFMNEYARYRQRARWFEPSAYLGKLSRQFGSHPLRKTAKEALKRGLFKKPPSSFVLDRLVDFHVAHSPEEAAEGRGLDFEALESALRPLWRRVSVKTYAYFGSFNPLLAPRRWQERSRQMEQRFPSDGANFSAVWERVG